MATPGGRPVRIRPKTSNDFVSRESAKVRAAGNKRKKTTDLKPAAINLRSVAEVLLEYGMNPAESVVKALKSGKLDAKTEASVGLALIEYLQPKLKAVEHKGEVKVDPVQIDRQLEALLTKMKGSA